MLFTNPLDMHDGLASLTGWAQADPGIQPRMHASNQVDMESIQVPHLEEGRSIDTRGIKGILLLLEGRWTYDQETTGTESMVICQAME